MKKLEMSLMVLLLSSFWSLNSQAMSIEVKAKISVHNEYTEIDLAEVMKAGWKVKEDQYGEQVFNLEKKIPVRELPFFATVGDAFIHLSKSGLLKMGIEVGDADAGSVTTFQLPKSRGRFAPIRTPFIIENSGGDHASGVWGVQMRVEMEIFP